MPHVERLRVYPVKGLDAVELEESSITDAGTMSGDRAYALTVPDGDGERPINAKQSKQFHEIRSRYDPASDILTLRAAGDEQRFDLTNELEAAGVWFSDVFDREVKFRRRDPPAFVDRPNSGPSVISTATLEAVASWFEGITVESARRRLRANVEIGGVPAFWEDRFVGSEAPAFAAGGVRFEGVEPCARCVVPSRSPDSGDPLPEFRERFAERREAAFPDWADPSAFDHYYALMLISRIPDGSRGESLAVGEGVELLSQ